MVFITLEDGIHRFRIAVFNDLDIDSLVEGLLIHLVGQIDPRGPKANDYKILELAAPVAT